jgi:hypothetical protein
MRGKGLATVAEWVLRLDVELEKGVYISSPPVRGSECAVLWSLPHDCSGGKP